MGAAPMLQAARRLPASAPEPAKANSEAEVAFVSSASHARAARTSLIDSRKRESMLACSLSSCAAIAWLGSDQMGFTGIRREQSDLLRPRLG